MNWSMYSHVSDADLPARHKNNRLKAHESKTGSWDKWAQESRWSGEEMRKRQMEPLEISKGDRASWDAS